MNKFRFMIPALFSGWSVLGIGLVLLVGMVLGEELAVHMLMAGMPWCVLILSVLSIVTSEKYRKEGCYKQLAFWGMLQKPSYIPMGFLWSAIYEITYDGEPLDTEKYGLIALLPVVMMGFVIIFLLGIVLLGLLIGLIVSATYTIKAIQGLYRMGRITKVLRVLLIIGSLMIPIDIVVSIIVWILLRRVSGIENLSNSDNSRRTDDYVV